MSFHKHVIDFSETALLDRLVMDYLDGKCAWLSGYEKNAAFDDVLKRRKNDDSVNRQLLVEVLKEQNKKLNALQLENIDALLKANTFTVTTGHQLNLFTGPLYFIYKIVTTINLARTLNEKYPQQLFVPIYWMASEDHDIAEVNHANVYGKKIEWHTEQTGAVGRMKCLGIEQLVSEVALLLGEGEDAKRIVEILRESYSDYHTMAEATRMLVNELFGKYGLLILDADDRRLKEEFTPVIMGDLSDHVSFNLVNETIEKLKKNKYHEQVHPAEVNLFFMADNIRTKVIKVGEEFHVEPSQRKLWDEKTVDINKRFPAECFSPNVVLRTLYQETILPNVAYVGGPAEIAYWLEYRSLFDHFDLSYPVLVLRNMAMIVDAQSHARMKKLGFTPQDFFLSMDELAKQYVLRNTNNFSFSEEASLITQAFNSLSQKIAGIDNTLKATAEAERQKNLNSLKTLEEKVLRAEKKKHETAIQQIQKIKDKIFPGGILHERTDNLLQYYARYGDSFIEMLKQNFDPLEEKVTILVEEEN